MIGCMNKDILDDIIHFFEKREQERLMWKKEFDDNKEVNKYYWCYLLKAYYGAYIPPNKHHNFDSLIEENLTYLGESGTRYYLTTYGEAVVSNIIDKYPKAWRFINDVWSGR